jgi:gamma-glutamyltranspeptidase/glutathione hydrolase
MALQWLENAGPQSQTSLDHLGVELTEAVFGYRDRCAEDGARLLDAHLEVDRDKASRRGGPRAYLHTTGVAVADAEGMVVSSLLSVFDDFGSGTFVPECGLVLNNRAAGFTGPPNAPGPGRRPVHTLAPAILEVGGTVTALATPGADGQVQTLLQVLLRLRGGGQDLAAAVAAPRWRSEGGNLMVAHEHPALSSLRERGHLVVGIDGGDARFGAVVSATSGPAGPSAVGDWRRQVATGGT